MDSCDYPFDHILQPLLFSKPVIARENLIHCLCRQVNVRFKHLVTKQVNQGSTMAPNASQFKCRPISMNNTKPFGIYWTQVLLISQARQGY